MRLRILIRILQFPAAFGIVLGIALLYHKVLPVNATTVALTFLLAILAVSTVWGMAVAVAMSVAAMLAFNYFFLPPTGTFRVADPENWVALLAFLAISPHARARRPRTLPRASATSKSCMHSARACLNPAT